MKTTLYFVQERYQNMDDFLLALDQVESELPASCSGSSYDPAVVSIGSFLQGFCGNLARYFHAKYGLPIGILSVNGEMFHIFNYVTKGEIRYYLDVRGVTDEWDCFIAPFQQDEAQFESAEEFYGQSELPSDVFPEDTISDAMLNWLLEKNSKDLNLDQLAKSLLFIQYGQVPIYQRPDEPFLPDENTMYGEFEVMIDPEGNIVKALPSHQEFLIMKSMILHGYSRELLMAACPPAYYYDFMRWLIPMSGGWIPVWNIGVMDYPVTKKQLAALKKLKVMGFYRGKLPPVQA